MKWILSHTSDGIHHWQLQQTNGTRFLNINLQNLSIRVSGFSKRLFFLAVQGFLHKKVLLRSEYGVEIGETAFADQPALEALTLNDQKFFYLRENGLLKLFDSEKNLLAACELTLPAAMEKLEFYSLLFGFAWLQTADVLTENASLTG